MDAKRRLVMDTSPDARRWQIEGWRAMPPWRRAQLVDAWSNDVRRMAMIGIRQQHPGIADDEALLRLGARVMPRELMRRAFGWDPRIKGY